MRIGDYVRDEQGREGRVAAFTSQQRWSFGRSYRTAYVVVETEPGWRRHYLTTELHPIPAEELRPCQKLGEPCVPYPCQTCLHAEGR